MPNPADPSVFTSDRRDIDITEEQLLGKHTFENVLYDGSTSVVNVCTGDTPSMLDKSVEEAKRFAASSGDPDQAPRVAKKLTGEQAIETRTPYVSSAFFHMDITGSLAWHTVFRQAWESDAYEVSHIADYETGDLTIGVKRADC